jgi:hypothetical protein
MIELICNVKQPIDDEPPMTNLKTNEWEEEFDKEFKFWGIEHQLEGDALSQDLKSFIRTKLSEAHRAGAMEVIEDLKHWPVALEKIIQQHYPETVWPDPPDDQKAKNAAAAQLMRTLGASIAKFDLMQLLEELLSKFTRKDTNG